ncbi:MAG TPA: flagellar basal body rod protein FlgB [Permianibacter sp.]|nr:flagellar basal body rod protein FlgB [Permianibacter sp.]
MTINFNKAFGIHEQALDVQSRRSAVLANNIANADTPGFKARDIDFRQALQNAMHANQSSGLARTDSRHFSGNSRYLSTEQQYRVPMQPDTGDGNTVDANVEQAAFAQNAIQYQTSLTFLNSKIRGLLTAIRGE